MTDFTHDPKEVTEAPHHDKGYRKISTTTRNRR